MSTFSPLYTDLGGTHLDGDRLLQLCLLLHGEHTLPSWMKELEPGQLNLLEIRLQPMPRASAEPHGPCATVFFSECMIPTAGSQAGRGNP